MFRIDSFVSDLDHNITNDVLKPSIPLTRKERISKCFEGDETIASTIFTFFSICFVLTSVLGLILGSIHEFQVPIQRSQKNYSKNLLTTTMFNDNDKTTSTTTAKTMLFEVNYKQQAFQNSYKDMQKAKGIFK